MRNPLKSTIADYLLACIHMITASKHPILLKYIPAHKGYLGNEIADSLAKEGAENSHTLENNETITDQKNQNKLQIKNQTIKKAQQEWAAFATNNKTFNAIFPTPDLWNKYKENSKLCKKIHNLIMESIPIGTYLFKIGIKESNLCLTCGVPDTLQHFLLHCQAYTAQREKYLHSLHQPISKMHILRGDTTTITAAENFLISTLYSDSFVN